jgi:hypothetical protein
MLVAVLFEERDLVRQFGDAYRRYQESTPRYLPRLRDKRAAGTAAASLKPRRGTG